MKEEKTLFQSPANVDTVTEKRQRMERYGWILENSQFDQDRNVTRLFYTRDLSIPENLQKKEWEEEVRDAVLAQRFAENNIAYCERRKNDTKKPRSHKAVIISIAQSGYNYYACCYTYLRRTRLFVPFCRYFDLRKVRDQRRIGKL